MIYLVVFLKWKNIELKEKKIVYKGYKRNFNFREIIIVREV